MLSLSLKSPTMKLRLLLLCAAGAAAPAAAMDIHTMDSDNMLDNHLHMPVPAVTGALVGPLEESGDSSAAPTPAPVPYAPIHAHGVPILERHGLSAAERAYWEQYSTLTYFTSPDGNRAALHFHIAATLITLFVTYPLSLVLSSVGSPWFLPVLTLNMGLSVSSMVCAGVFAVSFPQMDWYKGPAYFGTCIALFVLVLVHWAAAVLSRIAKYVLGEEEYESVSTEDIPMEQFSMDDAVTALASKDVSPPTSNEDSLPPSHSHDLSFDVDLEMDDPAKYIPAPKKSVQTRFLHSRVFAHPWVRALAASFGSLAAALFHLINYPLLVYYFFNACVGLATGNRLGQGSRIFNLLAHWIKGAVFLLLGVVSLARYCGVGRSRGWAWNSVAYTNDQRFKSRALKFMPRGTLTMEFIESFLIFFYGSTNIFLEHLAASADGLTAWTAKDLQHVSIAFMYIGTGLCGLLTEIKLNKWRYTTALRARNLDSTKVYAATPGFSPNPFPTMTIFWTGILMSQHAQASHTSTQIHMQWGYLLSYGSFFRIFTFLILYFKPPTDESPTKPLTEIVTSLCLLVGGLIFMESTDQVVEAMDYRGYTPMFTFNVSVGVVALFMAWIMILCMWREWLLQCRSERQRV